jgi:outer membrane protein assembly factor BamB
MRPAYWSDPDALQWRAWKNKPMTAIIMAGDTLLSGGHGKIYATAAADGKELWSAEVPGEVTDLAFHGGRLVVVCMTGELICFAK